VAADAVAAERKVPAGGDPAELVLDGGFAVPDANAFGNTFR
jgi:inositol oxygenase